MSIPGWKPITSAPGYFINSEGQIIGRRDVIKHIVAGHTWRYIEIDLPFLPPPDCGGTHV